MSKPMTITVTDAANLVASLPAGVRRRAGFKVGDQLIVEAVPGAVTITPKAVEPTYKPTKAEWAAIRKGEAAIARGDSVSLAEFLNVDSHNRKARSKGGRKVSR